MPQKYFTAEDALAQADEMSFPTKANEREFRYAVEAAVSEAVTNHADHLAQRAHDYLQTAQQWATDAAELRRAMSELATRFELDGVTDELLQNWEELAQEADRAVRLFRGGDANRERLIAQLADPLGSVTALQSKYPALRTSYI